MRPELFTPMLNRNPHTVAPDLLLLQQPERFREGVIMRFKPTAGQDLVK
jgi:hypothetical protein